MRQLKQTPTASDFNTWLRTLNCRNVLQCTLQSLHLLRLWYRQQEFHTVECHFCKLLPWLLALGQNFKKKPGGKLVWWDKHREAATSKLILAVGLDGHIGGGIGDASEAESIAHLVIIQESLVALVNAALKHLASAAGARSSTAGVWQFQAFLLSLIQDVHVLRALEGLSAIRGLKSHLEVGWHSGTSGHSVHDGWHIACCQCAFGQGLAAQVHALLRCHKGLGAGGQEATQQSCAAGRNHQDRQHTRLRSHCLTSSWIGKNLVDLTAKQLSSDNLRIFRKYAWDEGYYSQASTVFIGQTNFKKM